MGDKKHKNIRRHILLGIFSILAAYIGIQIYKYKALYATAWDVPVFQTIGDENAAVTVMEFTDYNCPYCRKIHPVIQDVLSLTPDIHFISRPIGPLGEKSQDFARLALAAGEQGRFWEVHNAFLSRKGPINDTFIEKVASENDIDVRQLYEDAQSEKIQTYLDKNTESASVLGIRYIPALMINKNIYVPENGEASVKDLVRVIRDASR